MFEIFEFEQGTPEWFQCRMGIPTASNFSAVLAKGEGKTRRSYMMKLLGERLTGEPADSYSNGHMERGHEMENEARQLYAFMNDAELTQIGFIRNGSKGCSPDSLLGENGMVEIKTKLPHIQLETILSDKVPSEHIAQIQGQLWVAEREFCDLVSYWPKLPLFVKRVFRDEIYIETLRIEIDRFNDELDALAAKIGTRQS